MDRKWWTLIAVCLGTFMLLLDVTIVNVALPSIQSSLKASFSDLQWVVDAYALMLAALLLTTGSLADLFGRRRLFVIGLVVFSISSLMSGLAQTPIWLNLARGAQGVGGAAMFSTSLALLGNSFQGRERGTAFGVWGAITGLAVAIGPVIGGALTTGISWRWIFLVNVPIGVIGVFISVWRVEESKRPDATRPDLLGALFFSGALAALIYALIEGDASGWTSTKILACLGGALGLLILWLIAELVQGPRALFDLSLLRKPTFTGGLIAAFALSGGLFALFLYLTLYLQDVLGYSALQTGLRFLTLSGGILLTSTLAGRLTSQVPIRFLIAPGLLLCAVGLFLMHGVHAGTRWTHLIPGFIVAGAGTGFINPPLASTAIGVVRPDRAGMASGINSTFRQVGIATGIAGLGSIFTHKVRTGIIALLSGAKGISQHAARALASAVAQGGGARSGMTALPKQSRSLAVHAIRASFTTGLNEIFLVGAALAAVAAVLTLVLIRSKDFEEGAARTVAQPGSQGEAAAEAGEDGLAASADAEPDEATASQVATVPDGATASEAATVPDGATVPEAATAPEAATVPDAGLGGTELDGADVEGTESGGAESGGAEKRGAREQVAEPAPAPTLERIAAAAVRSRSSAWAHLPEDEATDDAVTSGTFRDVGNGFDATPPATAVRRAIETASDAEQAALEYAREIGEARRHLADAAEHLDLAGAAWQRLSLLVNALDDGVAAAAVGPNRRPVPDAAPGVSPEAEVRASRVGADPSPHNVASSGDPARWDAPSTDPVSQRTSDADGPAHGDGPQAGDPAHEDASEAGDPAHRDVPSADESATSPTGSAGTNGGDPGEIPSASGFRRF